MYKAKTITATFLFISLTLLTTMSFSLAAPLANPQVVELWGIIPSGERSITTLVMGPYGMVYGGTSGKAAHVFSLDLRTGMVQDLDRIEGPICIHRSGAILPDGSVGYVGTMRDAAQLEEEPDFEGGHIYRYPGEGGAIKADLGIPVPQQGIYAMELDVARNLIYGMTYPSGQFFVWDLETNTRTDLRDVSGNIPHQERKVISQDLIQDEAGNVYFSGADGHILKYNADTGDLQVLPQQLPAVLGRHPWAGIDVITRGPDGLFYGGTTDGYIFTFDPETQAVRNLGKVLRQHHIQGMVWGPDGVLYGVAGEPDGLGRTFTYDPKTHSFELGGIASFSNVGDMVAEPSGKIIAGELGRIADLLVYSTP